MLLLLLLLCAGLRCSKERSAGCPLPEALQDLGPHHPAPEEPLAFHLLQVSSFANRSWAHTQASGWLSDLQTHGWDPVLGTIYFLKPWPQGNFSQEELKYLQSLFQLYFYGFTQEAQAFASQFHFEYPFELQISAGCRMHSTQRFEGFLNGAYQGLDFLSFQGGSWEPCPAAGDRAHIVCKVLNLYQDMQEIVQSLLGDTCPRLLAGLAMAGKSELYRQVKPEVWLSSGPCPGPGRLLLVCHISGFHPKSVWAMWMRGEQEQLGTWKSDIMPNSDETWYLRVTLDVAAWEAAGLSCRVKHSSLGGHDLIVHWGGCTLLPVWMMWTCLAVALALLLLAVLGSWCRRQSSNQSTLLPQMLNPAFPCGVKNTQDPRRSEHQLCLAQESRIKTGILKWKTGLRQLCRP